ncbi:nucleoside-diphosphate sugar epimerase/dehydratase [Enteractinococcus fodinae]|uniref:dTDP-glucose 4,6-dehydratase n=1 Tax=Enteractinococcus fodinae TaxID=684663 RepID=A0ABU2B5H3_9MICC|nr:nucleoside-diphosphate sugar epimerase/dehydratase [Enteractinococcus fodinae]MDR7348003.1 dTDP-glucose 4,6-dehydratase [Enteractinococcus fodinae]
MAVADASAWFVSVLLALFLRYEFDAWRIEWLSTVLLAVVMAGFFVLVGLMLGIYLGKYAYGSLDEVRTVTLAALLTSVVFSVFLLLTGFQAEIPRSLALLAFPLAVVIMFGLRFLYRLSIDRARLPAGAATPALVVGAGQAGEITVRTIMNDPDSPLRAVGLIDDDITKRRLRLHGVPVLGTSDDIEQVAKQTRAKVLVVAISNVSPEFLGELTDAGNAAGLRVLKTPTVQRLMEGPIGVQDLRSVSIEDLIGRTSVDTNVEEIAGFITGKKVLVTGAGGSIGSELCVQLAKFGPTELIMLDRDETSLQEAQIRLQGNGLLDGEDIVLADIRETELMRQVFASHQPEVVFHAAALKHLPMLEKYPEEAWKTNVLGTRNVVQAAMASGVETFVNISTDKAANPTSALGHSKRVAEKITAWAAKETGRPYLSVRFGNVIGSRGSMLPTFERLIENGGPVTVTHPEVTRYFMTIPEACQLVIQAGGIGRAGEVLILDMGEPIKILDIAKRMIAISGKDIEIVYTGLREGEKLHEELVGANEDLERPFHQQISHATVGSLSPENMDLQVWLDRMEHEKGAVIR